MAFHRVLKYIHATFEGTRPYHKKVLPWTKLYKNQLFDLVIQCKGHVLTSKHTKYESCRISSLHDLIAKGQDLIFNVTLPSHAADDLEYEIFTIFLTYIIIFFFYFYFFRHFQNIYITNTDITQQHRQRHYLYIHFQYKQMKCCVPLSPCNKPNTQFI